MLKAYFGIAFLLSSIIGFSSTPATNYEYYIIFVGEFENDKISVAINKKPIVSNYLLENVDSLKKGHLSITQSNDYITIAYNGKEIKRSYISVDFSLNLDITVNNRKKAFRINLKKGKVILVDYSSRIEQQGKILSVEQVQEPILFI